MDSKILEEKMELLRWIINLNDEQVIKNLINFKNEIFGVPFAEPTVCSTVVKSGSRGFGEIVLSEDYLKFEGASEGFLAEFDEAFSLEDAKKQSINILFREGILNRIDRAEEMVGEVYEFIENNLDKAVDTPEKVHVAEKKYLRYMIDDKITWFFFFKQEAGKVIMNHVLNNQSPDFSEL